MGFKYFSLSRNKMVDSDDVPYEPVPQTNDPFSGLTPNQKLDYQTEQRGLQGDILTAKNMAEGKVIDPTEIKPLVSDWGQVWNQLSQEGYTLKPDPEEQIVNDYAQQVANHEKGIDEVEEKYRGLVNSKVMAMGAEPLSKDEAKWARIDKAMATQAKIALKRLEPVFSGKLKGKEADSLVNQVAADYNQTAFKIAGTQLTEGETVILMGKLIRQEGAWHPGIKQKFFSWGGYRDQPATGKVLEDRTQIKSKLENFLAGQNYLNDFRNQSTALPNEPGRGGKYDMTPFGQKLKEDFLPTLAQLGGNALTDLLGLGKSIVSEVGGDVNYLKQAVPLVGKSIMGDQQSLQNLSQLDQQRMAESVGKGEGMLDFLKNLSLLKVGQKGEPIKIEPNPGGVQAMYNNPVSGGMAVLPFSSPIQKFLVNKTPTIPNNPLDLITKRQPAASQQPVNMEGMPLSNKGIANDVRGRLATSITKPDLTDYANSEMLARQTVRLTKSLTEHGMARELEPLVRKSGQLIDDTVKQYDSKIGPQVKTDALDKVDKVLSDTQFADRYQQDINDIHIIVDKKLSSGEQVGGGRGTEWEGTNLVKMNEARKFLNSQIPKKWFADGMPVATDVEVRNYLTWQASNVLKDLIGEADGSGILSKAINAQHVALSVEPSLSKQIQTKGAPGFSGTALKMLETATHPIKIGAERLLEGGSLRGKDPILKLLQNQPEPGVAAPSAQMKVQAPLNRVLRPEIAPVEPNMEPVTVRGGGGNTLYRQPGGGFGPAKPQPETPLATYPEPLKTILTGKVIGRASKALDAVESVLAEAKTPAEAATKLDKYVADYSKTANYRQLADLRAALVKKIGAYIGGTGNWKQDFALRQLHLSEGSPFKPVIESLQKHIDAIDNKIKPSVNKTVEFVGEKPLKKFKATTKNGDVYIMKGEDLKTMLKNKPVNVVKIEELD